jgi:hypothetical protein
MDCLLNFFSFLSSRYLYIILIIVEVLPVVRDTFPFNLLNVSHRILLKQTNALQYTLLTHVAFFLH